MRKFVVKILTLIFIVILVIVILVSVIQWLPPQFSDTYNAAILDKYQRLMTTQSPKIILLAGSNFAFGFDSKMIEESLHMPVVNLGLHAGLRIHFMIEIAKANIQKGDIVVIGFEYPLYNDNNVSVQEMFTAIENYPYLWPFIDPGQYSRLATGYFQRYARQKIDRYMKGITPSVGVYSRMAFNQYGDIMVDRPACVLQNSGPAIIINKDIISHNTISYLNRFNDYVVSRGATLYLTYPSTLKDAITSTSDEISGFVQALEETVRFPIISEIQDYILPRNLFYDNQYHLNNEGIEVRTKKLIEDISKAIAQ
jgi:hypothetical protein